MSINLIGQFQIEIIKVDSYQINSSDNTNDYDFVYCNLGEYRDTTMLGIKVFADNALIRSAIIGAEGGGTGDSRTSKVLEPDRLVICCSDSVFCLSIPNLNLIWKTQADQATCFEIFSYKQDYIVHGELEISRLDVSGNIIWSKSGADIFTTIDGKDDFLLFEDFILAKDWTNTLYKFSYDGEDLS